MGRGLDGNVIGQALGDFTHKTKRMDEDSLLLSLDTAQHLDVSPKSSIPVF